jgi:hypothetical protein
VTESRNPGRAAGWWYLLLTLLGPVRLIYIPKHLFVRGDAAATAANLVAHERLFRVGMASDLAAAVVLVMMTLAMWRLFRRVDEQLAALVVILGGVMPAVLYFVNIATDEATLAVARGPAFLSAFDKPQRDALALLLLKLHDGQNTAAETLWGAWLIPLGILVYRSGFLPRFIGWWLWLDGAAYLVMSFTEILAPAYATKMFVWFQPALLGEVALVLWLLVRGVRAEELERESAAVREPHS